MKRLLCVALALMLGAVLLSASPADATNIGDEGCPTGYWRRHQDNWEEYQTITPLDKMFPMPPLASAFADMHFVDALSFKGGPGYEGAARTLLRVTVTAFLNAAHEGVGYPHRRFNEPGNMAIRVERALASGDRARMLDLAHRLDAANNLGCPLR